MDLNNDGYDDLLSGSYSRMERSMAGLFQVLWGQSDGSFKKAEVLKGTDDEPLIIPADDSSMTEKICTRPTAADWDADGDLDLVVGNFSGTFYVFFGEGEARFTPKPEQVMADNGPLKINGAHSDPFIVDWDNDGDLDLLSGSSQGGVQWAENKAGPGKAPNLAAFKVLIEPEPQRPYGEPLAENELTGPAGSTRVWADDINADGKLDILVGDTVTLIEPKGLSEEQFKEKFAQWQESLQEASEEMRTIADPEKRNAAYKRVQELYEERNEFMDEQGTGFVWLYVQK